MKDKGMPKADFVMGLILMACSLVIVIESLKIPHFEKDWGGFYAAPGFARSSEQETHELNHVAPLPCCYSVGVHYLSPFSSRYSRTCTPLM